MNEPNQTHHQVGVYNRMMERVRHMLEDTEHKSRPSFDHVIARARDRAVELGEATLEDAAQVADYLKRDLSAMAGYMHETGKEYSDWFHMDLELIEARLLDLITSVADQTEVEWARWAAQAQQADQLSNYRSGEITGPGTLECIACGEQLRFVKTGRIPPCSACHAGEFRRLTA